MKNTLYALRLTPNMDFAATLSSLKVNLSLLALPRTHLFTGFASHTSIPKVFSERVFSEGVFSKSVFFERVFSESIFSKNVFSKSVFSESVCSESVCSKSVFSKSVFSESVFFNVYFPKVYFLKVYFPKVFFCFVESVLQVCKYFGSKLFRPKGYPAQTFSN